MEQPVALYTRDSLLVGEFPSLKALSLFLGVTIKPIQQFLVSGALMGGVFLIKPVNVLTIDPVVSDSIKAKLLVKFKSAWAAHLKATNIANSLVKGEGARLVN